MTGHDDRQKNVIRQKRQYSPEIQGELEHRLALSTATAVPLSDAPEVTTTALMTQTRAIPKTQKADWNSMAGLSWLKGVWKSNTKIDFMQAIARSMGASKVQFPSIPSLDTWLVNENQYVGRTALAAQHQTAMPLDGLVITPGGIGGTTSLAMTSADGTAPVPLTLTSVQGNNATFTGVTPIIETTTDAIGNETTTTTAGAPVRVNIVKRNANSMRITAEMQTEGKWIRMFTYTATKTRQVAAQN